ncbi:cation-transporting P-type ATPase [Geodermatophilus aquaeductus]|uniref:ATPase, P-type (Transporting), HAD superfamily, subfamily IC n=1 Tax=Geodermatophilus aquaeductus TaxID=1564161 RepID=A0A521FV78_9ACTN|nr:cation-transporting P-type ATPase [Geodermatophilus aquaeductus]SMP00032.1 ATPase, P-type (transporting), HAD superfamily, subfamily IC [Geodermatophilus aquaeductus]
MTTTTPAPGGLSGAEAARRRPEGGNRLPVERPPSPVRLLVGQLVHFFALLLWGAAGLALVGGMPQLAVAIVVVVVLNGVFAFVQEYRADKAAEALRDLVPHRVTVVRDGRRQEVDAVDLVVGDLVLQEAGDRIAADLRLVDVHGLRVDEATLTGESVPVDKDAGDPTYAGCFIVEGEASAEVVAIAGDTRLASIATMTRTVERAKTSLTKELNRVVRLVTVAALGLGAVCFGAGFLIGLPLGEGFLFAVGVTVALVPEGLLPTVTLSLARSARMLARRRALVRRLESVETLGSTTFICTDKTGTLTQNRMSVVAVWTPQGSVTVRGTGYEPTADLDGAPGAADAARVLATTAVRCSSGHVREDGGSWTAVGDPMEAALDVLARRLGGGAATTGVPGGGRRFSFDPRRRRMSVWTAGELSVKGAPDSVLPRCRNAGDAAADATAAAHAFAVRGLRVLAVARRTVDLPVDADADTAERDLELLGLVGIEDPPRPDVAEALAECRRAGIAVAMITGDSGPTAAAIAREIGLWQPGSLVVEGKDLPADPSELGEQLDRDGTVVCRVAPEDKLRIAQALQARGHVVAMTGDGVNDGPALRAADIGVAMGASGTDVARQAADLVLLDDHFATIVAAVRQGRATFANIRRFLTYHLSDNVAELTPFVVFSVTGGGIPLALGVLQILCLDIVTDQGPALALGAEPASARVLDGPPPRRRLVDGAVLRRALGVLGPVEAAVSMLAFLAVLTSAGWSFGADVPGGVLASASGAAFAAVVLGQAANAWACRSSTRPFWRLDPRSNALLVWAVGVELVLLAVVLAVPPVAGLLGQALPPVLGLGVALLAVPAVLLADAAHKGLRTVGRRRGAGAEPPAPGPADQRTPSQRAHSAA